MSGVARVGDQFGPGGRLTAPFSPDVTVNDRPVALLGCVYTAHTCCGKKGCPPTHCFGSVFVIPSGVTVNGLPPVVKGSRGLCGHKVQSASQDVIVVTDGLLGMVGDKILDKVF